MIIGKVETIRAGALITHNDTYAITDQTHIFVIRPFRMVGTGIGGALIAFAWGCHDLLYMHEFAVLGGIIAGLVLLGERVAHLSIINRDLPGSELSTALWGTYGDLNRVRRDIDAANPKPAQSTSAGGLER